MSKDFKGKIELAFSGGSAASKPRSRWGERTSWVPHAAKEGALVQGSGRAPRPGCCGASGLTYQTVQWGEASVCWPTGCGDMGSTGSHVLYAALLRRDDPPDSPGGSAALPSAAAQTPNPCHLTLATSAPRTGRGLQARDHRATAIRYRLWV